MAEKKVFWKEEHCLMGTCRGLREKHRLSIPFTTPSGLVTECYDCGKTRSVRVERDTDETEVNPE